MKIGIYSGSFDPVTNGHIDIIKRAMQLVDKLVIGVLNNKNKNCMFSLDERVNMIKIALDESCIDRSNIEVEAFSGMLVEFAGMKNATLNIRGVRSSLDYEYEKNMADINKELDSKLETVVLFADKDTFFISSTMVKEIASYGKDITRYVPKCVNKALDDFYKGV